MMTGRHTNSITDSGMCLTRRGCGVLALGALVAGLSGCVPAQTASTDTGGMLTSSPSAILLAEDRDDGSVRIEAIQRYDGLASETVTGVVTVRNTTGAPRTINVGVTWLGNDGTAIASDGAARETVTLGPRESRELVFRGEQGSRDFKVALSSAVQ